MATVRARSDAILLAVHRDELEKLLDVSPSAARAMLHTILQRWRNTEAMLRQSEKLAQLGTLSAGVAHELNNPAAAVSRGTGQLQNAMDRLDRAQARLASHGVGPAQQERLAALLNEGQLPAERAPLGVLERSDLEDELEHWLDEQGVDDPWEYVATLVDIGLGSDRIQTQLDNFSPAALPAALAWLDASFTMRSLLHEVSEGAARIADIVHALKSYAYLDQAPVQEVDIHTSLENTLTILRSQLKSIEVERDYAPNLPIVQAYGSELNQVFTNILDNAAEAVAGAFSDDSQGQGRIVIRTRAEKDTVVIEIEDNGPGIPPEIISRVFDPFFTTKPPGKGTGLGLNISYNIIVVKHRGDLSVSSEPGKTCFHIRLPIDFEEDAAAQPAPTPPVSDEDERLQRILEETRTIAVVGMSSDPHKAAHTVPLYLRDHGYEIMPVNPRGGQLADLRAYRDLFSLPKVPDVVLVFRPSNEAPEIVEQAVRIGAQVVWMQPGIRHEGAAETARNEGLEVVMDTCMRTTHRRLMAQGPTTS
jgi:signal transduction histidine kinase/predicted CoA-binding protein